MLTPNNLIHILRARGHVVFDGGAYDLNLVGLRRNPGTLDSFDDELAVLYRAARGRAWTVESLTCTTDPGKPSFANSKRRQGAPVIDLGQHRGAYTFGQHKSTYECLVPTRPIPVTRYKSEEDYRAGRGSASTSNLVQIHRANAKRASTIVSTWSEGCVVLADPVQFDRLLALCHLQEKAGHGNRFTFTVLDWNF